MASAGAGVATGIAAGWEAAGVDVGAGCGAADELSPRFSLGRWSFSPGNDACTGANAALAASWLADDFQRPAASQSSLALVTLSMLSRPSESPLCSTSYTVPGSRAMGMGFMR